MVGGGEYNVVEGARLVCGRSTFAKVVWIEWGSSSSNSFDGIPGSSSGSFGGNGAAAGGGYGGTVVVVVMRILK